LDKIRIEVYGYGAEVSSVRVSKEVWDFWREKDEEAEPAFTTLNYIYDVDVDVPEKYKFLTSDWWGLSDYGVWGVDADYAKISIEVNDKVEEVEYNDWSVKSVDDGMEYKEGYYITLVSEEKGNFFSTEFETEKWNKDKLTVYTMTDDATFITGMTYNGETLDNDGGDTNGKGSSVYFWENE